MREEVFCCDRSARCGNVGHKNHDRKIFNRARTADVEETPRTIEHRFLTRVDLCLVIVRQRYIAEGLLQQEMDKQAYIAAQNANTAAAYQNYLKKYPKGLYRVNGLCCTNRVRDSSRESNVVAAGHEQTHAPRLQDPELA